MARLAFFQVLAALAASVHVASATPLYADHVERSEFPRSNGQAWPADVSDLVFDDSWPDFEAKTTRWSSYRAPTFDEVFLPETERDLSRGLKYLSGNNMQFLAKSGGHGYAPTLEKIQDGVLINLENFNQVQMRPDGTAVVGPGVRFSKLVDTVAGAGRELTVGSCPCVGATGAMLGGGLGRMQGLHGLTSDALRSVRVALWNGTIIEASDKVNQDLFWGIRGSGQNYGILVESRYQTWPATNNGMHYTADLTFEKSSIKRIMEVTNKLTAKGLNKNLSILMFLASDAATGKLSIIVNLVYSGPEKEAKKYTREFSSFSTSVTESMVKWEELPAKTVFGLIPQSCQTGLRQNLKTLNTKTLDPAMWVKFGDAFEKFLQANPLANSSAMMIETFPVQGVKALPEDYSAFPHRKYFDNVIESIGSYRDDSVGKVTEKFFREWRDKFAQPKSSGFKELHVYQNYAHDDEPLSALYGYEKWRHERLTNLKNKYDPHGFFNGYHPVPSKLKDWSKKR